MISSIPTSPIIAMTMRLTHEASASFLKVGMSRHYLYNFPASVQKIVLLRPLQIYRANKYSRATYEEH